MKTRNHRKLLSIGGMAALSLAILATAGCATRPPPSGSGSFSYSQILSTVDGVTGVRGVSTNGGPIAVLTGTHGNVMGYGGSPIPQLTTTAFLYQGPVNARSIGAAATQLIPPFPDAVNSNFYGPNTRAYNPSSIPRGSVRAVGTYGPSLALNKGMIYLGPVTGGGTWTSIEVPAHGGSSVVGGVSACGTDAQCLVLNTIPHSTMGDLVVGNYDLSSDLTTGNAFIYNMTTQKWTLLDLNGSMDAGTTLYGIWQNGGDRSPNYTLVGGAVDPATGISAGVIMNYNETSGAISNVTYLNEGNPATVTASTHVEGITSAPGGYMLAAQGANLDRVYVRVNPRTGVFGTPVWTPVNVQGSSLCTATVSGVPTTGQCLFDSADTVYEGTVMGTYIPPGAELPNTYVATPVRR